MRILIYSPLFYPSVGGLETVISILAEEFSAQGHEVKVVCQIPTSNVDQFPFVVIRRPSPSQLLYLTNWCEVYLQGCISLKGLWPLLLKPRPLIVSHHTWYHRSNGRVSWQDVLKQWVARVSTNISVSAAIADSIWQTSTVIPNPYQDKLFRLMPNIPRQKELIFVGRLVSDKGIHVLLSALSQLKMEGLTPHLTIVGSGPEEIPMQETIRDLGLTKQVSLVGKKTGDELVSLLNEHQIMVVPSLWNEPFGVVALEGMACGCVVIGSEGGGLKDAIGDCGVTFPNGDVAALKQVLVEFLNHPESLALSRSAAAAHLLRHRPAAIAQAYLNIFEEILS
jgi:glycogen synthase